VLLWVGQVTHRCSTCGVNHPTDEVVCPACGGGLWVLKDVEPDVYAAAEAIAAETSILRDARYYDAESDEAVIGWRVECIEGLGFPPGATLRLAARRDIDRAHVERMVRHGATPAQVCRIVL
jgi:hypothetical protein